MLIAFDREHALKFSDLIQVCKFLILKNNFLYAFELKFKAVNCRINIINQKFELFNCYLLTYDSSLN